MTAELEEQDKKSEKEVEAEKISSPKEEDAPKNGGGDVKKIEDDDEKPVSDEKPTETETETQQQEEESEPVVAKKRKPTFLARLFRRGDDSAKQQDPEAGTELLAKDGKVEIKSEEDGKKEKSEDNGTDAAAAAADDPEAGPTEKKKGTSCFGSPDKNNLKRFTIAFVVGFIAILAIVVVVSLLTSSDSASRGPLGDPLAVTDCGEVKGYKEDGIYVFKGIPYAIPPIGDLRWKPPMQVSSVNDCWTGAYEAYNASAICYQKPIPGFSFEMSEDCLYLDVITPSLSPPVLRPVVVYIPGDHPLQGYSSADAKWRPTTAIADAKDVTFVTINYRTNVFGFMSLDLLTERMRPPTSGNYGIMDMIAALKWVQRNIRSFGGDPEKVTVLAHGGAATAGIALLSSKKTDNLFSQMWLTAPSAHFSNKTLEQIGAQNSIFLKKLDCTTLTCLYDKTAEEVLAAMPGSWASDWFKDLPSTEEEQSPVMTVIDGNILYDTPYNMWKAGNIQKVPVVIGSAAQESGSSNLLPNIEKWNWSDFTDNVREKLEKISENITEAALQLYVQNASTPLQQYHTMVSDVRTICPLERLTEALGEALQSDSSYWYLVDYKPSAPIQFSNESSSVRLSVHGLDIAAIFGLLEGYVNPISASDTTFEKNMQDLFYSFVKSGKPKINGEILMSSNFINIIGDVVRSRMTPYENCHLWNNDIFFPAYAKMN